MSKRQVYLDYAAATPMDSRVIASMEPFLKEKFYNPSASSLKAKEVKKDLALARSQVASLLGSKSTEIIFTAGGTEANNLAITGIASNYPKTEIIISALEHESVLAPARQLKKHGWTIKEVKPDPLGLINISEIVNLVTDKTVLVSVMYANNEVGTVQPIKQLAQHLQKIKTKRKLAGNKTPLYLHTDGAQAANYLDIHVNQLGIDLMTLNGGKIYGPKQSGVLFIKTGVVISPIIHGGGQERGLRSGTENTAACIGFATALQITSNLRKDETYRLGQLQKYFISSLENKIPEIQINGSMKYRLPNNIHITLPGTDNEKLLYGLEEKGVICAAGSACSASSEEASHVLLSMGLSEAEARASIRISMGRDTTKSDVDQFLISLESLLTDKL